MSKKKEEKLSEEEIFTRVTDKKLSQTTTTSGANLYVPKHVAKELMKRQGKYNTLKDFFNSRWQLTFSFEGKKLVIWLIDQETEDEESG